MKKVNEIIIAVGDYEDTYGPEESKNNSTIEMKALIDLIKERGYVKETDSYVADDNCLSIKVDEAVSIEQGFDLVKAFEEIYEVTEFSFKAEYDDFYEEEPYMLIFVRK